MILVVQVIMAIGLGTLILRNGRNGNGRFQVASEQQHPYQLSSVNSTFTRTDLYAGVPIDAELLELDKRALKEAYHAQLLNLWAVWLKGQAGDPQYFANGLKIARRAYGQASEQIAKREKQLGSGPDRTDERR
jgi:hypothetical protein